MKSFYEYETEEYLNINDIDDINSSEENDTNYSE